MTNDTQLARYKRLLAYIEEKFKEDINIEKVEAISHYSYRNINRIFQALHHKTIGKYIKRLRLEKAAQYLKYSETSISEIAYEVGFENIAAFSKAFKHKFNCSPTAFRSSNEAIKTILRQSLAPDSDTKRQKLVFEIEYLPNFTCLCLEYRGVYDDFKAIKKTWKHLLDYALQKDLLTNDSIFMTEILDDEVISDSINFRYNLAIILDKPLNFKLEGLFKTKVHQRQKYAKFIHKGTDESSKETYNEIYAFWMVEVNLEFADLPTLEFYLNDETDTPPEELLTEIYIPVQ